jgi:hypothetical protein
LQLGSNIREGPDLGDDNDMIKDPSDQPKILSEKEKIQNRLDNLLQLES